MNDFLSDDGSTFAKTMLNYDLPDYVAEADTQMEKVASLGDECFADPVTRSFPIHTRGHLFCSAVYAANQSEDQSLNDVRSNIHKRAGTFEILDDVLRVETYVKSLEVPIAKEASAPSVPFEIKIGPTRFSGSGKVSAEKIAHIFPSLVSELAADAIQPAARGLLKIASENGATVSIDLQKYAGIGTNSRDNIEAQKALRLLPLGLLEKSAAAAELKEINSAESLLKFDRRMKIAKGYGGIIEHPSFVFHSGFEPEEKTRKQKIAESFISDGSGGDVYAAYSVAFGQKEAQDLLSSGSFTDDPAKLAILDQYLS
jgi:hypothetical protein